MTRPHKWNAQPGRFNGMWFPTIAEIETAQQLDLLTRNGDVTGWCRHVQVVFGSHQYRIDFLVFTPNDFYFLEVKGGKKSTNWLQTRRLWPEYGVADLHVRTRNRSGNWSQEIIHGRYYGKISHSGHCGRNNSLTQGVT